MNTLDELEYLSEYREDNRIEAKRAQGGLPYSLWETYSAFANTLGGVILLGVAEAADKSLYSVHLPSPETLAEGFWRAVNDPKIASVNLLRPEDVRVVKSGKNHIVVIFVPPAAPEVRPVYVGGDPYTGSYFRSGEGDCRMPPEQVEALLRVPRAGGVAHEHGDAHGQPRHHHGDQVEQLAAGSHAGLLCRAGEAAHDQKVCRAVHGLQKQGQQHGHGEGQKGFQDISLGQGQGFHGQHTSAKEGETKSAG